MHYSLENCSLWIKPNCGHLKSVFGELKRLATLLNYNDCLLFIDEAENRIIPNNEKYNVINNPVVKCNILSHQDVEYNNVIIQDLVNKITNLCRIKKQIKERKEDVMTGANACNVLQSFNGKLTPEQEKEFVHFALENCHKWIKPTNISQQPVLDDLKRLATLLNYKECLSFLNQSQNRIEQNEEPYVLVINDVIKKFSEIVQIEKKIKETKEEIMNGENAYYALRRLNGKLSTEQTKELAHFALINCRKWVNPESNKPQPALTELKHLALLSKYGSCINIINQSQELIERKEQPSFSVITKLIKKIPNHCFMVVKATSV